MAVEGTYNGLRLAVRDGDGFGPACKAVDAGKEECLSTKEREGSDQIQVDLAEACIG